MKRKTSTIASLIMILLLFATLTTSIYAAGVYYPSYPSLSSTNYCEFISPNKITVYRDTGCTTPGTCTPANSYAAYIAKGDKCYIYRITSSYIQVNYPSRSGRSTGYIKRNALLTILPNNPSYAFTSRGKINTYKSAYGAVYGNTEKNDYVVCCREELDGGPYWFTIMYTAKSGNRGYKLGWVSLSDYKRILR